jgi:hypothetical protein
MVRSPLLLCLLLTGLTYRQAQACECQATFSSCREVKASDLVFIGTVASIEPIFLNRWYGEEQSTMQSLNDAFLQAEEHSSAETLRGLKDNTLLCFLYRANGKDAW